MDGVLVVDKPAGMTSADVVARVKKARGEAKVGHTGTLDPMATGVLPLVLGEATKLAPFLLADDKTYEGELELGLLTDTLDAEGAVLERRAADGVDEAAVRRALAELTGDQLQVPPMHSALRHQGRRLYELAREGVEIDRTARPVSVRRFELTAFAPPRARFLVDCSKGTYVRALVRDLGAALGCGATLTALRRTRAGAFTLAQAVPLDAAAQAPVTPLAEALAHLPEVRLDAAGTAAARHGRQLPAGDARGTVRLLDPDGKLVAVAEARGERLVYLLVFK